MKAGAVPLLTNEMMKSQCDNPERAALSPFRDREDESWYNCGMMFARDFYEVELARLRRIESRAKSNLEFFRGNPNESVSDRDTCDLLEFILGEEGSQTK
jgi:hypothetical protein